MKISYVNITLHSPEETRNMHILMKHLTDNMGTERETVSGPTKINSPVKKLRTCIHFARHFACAHSKV
jgi:hypothetical protein